MNKDRKLKLGTSRILGGARRCKECCKKWLHLQKKTEVMLYLYKNNTTGILAGIVATLV